MTAASAVGGALQDLTPQAGGRADAAVSASLGMDRAVVPASPDGPQASGSFAADAAGDGAAGVADPSQIPMEDQIAEQVAYWVHQKTQNAELTIDRDGQPVEVSVSLTGNEAHVAFRSDQSQTRDMLDTSVAQLRELLRGEGLELAGVSIGQSGAGAGGDASGRPSGRGEGGARIGRVQAAGGGRARGWRHPPARIPSGPRPGRLRLSTCGSPGRACATAGKTAFPPLFWLLSAAPVSNNGP